MRRNQSSSLQKNQLNTKVGSNGGNEGQKKGVKHIENKQ